jgi:TRAP-type C4-dicarboxylate transport system substrate-binding protein
MLETGGACAQCAQSVAPIRGQVTLFYWEDDHTMLTKLQTSLRRKVAQPLALLAGAAAMALMAAPAQAEVTIRLASDTAGLPHPAAIAMEKLKERVEAEIPGSSVRIFVSSSLYKIPEAMEAMTEGNLEMAWGQFGKTAQVDPYANVVVGPMLLTTPGAINAMDEFETYRMLAERFNDLHDVKLFGTAHMSFYMGIGAKEARLISPSDFDQKKMRSMGPAENAMLSAFGSNPTTMAFGDVPPALETGVIDGLVTSLGGWNRVKEQAPYFSVAGVNGIVGDYYYLAASNKWWNSVKPEHQAIIQRIIEEEVLPIAKVGNFCNDKQLIDRFGTTDPSEPGIYVMSQEEAGALAQQLGDATQQWIKSNTPSGADEWVDRFAEEARAAVAANPLGASELEKTDCTEMNALFAKYRK